MALDECLVCKNRYGGQCNLIDHTAGFANQNCTNCGSYRLSGSVPATSKFKNMNDMERAALTHQLQIHQGQKTIPLITPHWLDNFLKNSRLPSPSRQAASIIKFVGDHMMKTGNPVNFPPNLYAIVGSPNPEFTSELARELIDQKYLQAKVPDAMGSYMGIQDAKLTLAGWEKYEEEAQGRNASKMGFIAHKFANERLKNLIADTIKPAIRELGYDLNNLIDVARPGIIDNILRDTIRQSLFVLVDLTDDNYGAYWEAGFAEGLNKPVLYICEQEKFDHASTHFDTAHCTTVLWGGQKTNADFARELKATLRNSLAIFPHDKSS
jgi:hypothetical protein